jgi:hypothetical protein
MSDFIQICTKFAKYILLDENKNLMGTVKGAEVEDAIGAIAAAIIVVRSKLEVVGVVVLWLYRWYQRQSRSRPA